MNRITDKAPSITQPAVRGRKKPSFALELGHHSSARDVTCKSLNIQSQATLRVLLEANARAKRDPPCAANRPQRKYRPDAFRVGAKLSNMRAQRH